MKSLCASIILAGAVVALCSTPVQAQVHCEWCEEIWVVETGQYEHGFTGEECERGGGDEAQFCAACGGTSTCHTEAQPGKCHTDCADEGGGSLAVADHKIRTLVNNLVARAEDGQSRLGEILARALLTERMVYEESAGEIRLLNCSGTIIRRWDVPRIVQRSLGTITA